MISGKYRLLHFTVILAALNTMLVFAGTTGKIAGRVLDGGTREPLVGVNVLVKGTTLGATTDIEGYYTILLVPPRTHTVTASMVGYTSVNVNDVRVLIDQTASVNIELPQETIEMGDIVVVAQRDLVKKDVASSVTAVQPDEIESLPVTSISDVVGLQAGVDEGLVIRGGSSDQLLFQVDGATLRDPRNNRPISAVALSSIQEVSIERGGFSAEYGQVRSGIVNIVAKEGNTASYSGSVMVRYSPATPKHFGISVFDQNSMWNKPYLDPEVCWTGTNGEPFTDLNRDTYWNSNEPYTDINGDGRWTGWDKYTQRQYPRFDGGWNAISQRLLTDDDPTNDLSPTEAQRYWEWTHRRRPVKAPDYSVDGGFGGPVPFISKELGNLRFFTSFRLDREMLLIPLSRDDYKEYSWSAKVNSDVDAGKSLMLNASAGKSYNVAINENDKQFNNPLWGINGVAYWNPTDYMRTPFQIAEITNEQRSSRIFTNSWYSEASVDFLSFAGRFRNIINASSYYEISAEHINRKYSTGPIRNRDLTKRYEVVPGYFVDEAPFGYDPNPDSDLTGMFFGGHSSTSRDSSKLNSFSLKADLESQITNEHLLKTGVEFSYYDLNLDYGLYNVFFGDVNYVKEQWRPYRVSAYVQDKIEAYGFIAHLGIRMDVSNPNTEWVAVDPFDKLYFSTSYNTDANYPKQKVKPDVALSPRLGISHPITENSKLYFNYGHFKQMPAYEEVFRLGRSGAGSMRNFGDPALKQAQTVSYQLGYDHALFDMYQIQIAAFYNDISNEQGYTNYISDRKAVNYFFANNNNYRDVRGLELTLRKGYGDWVRGFATYTYQVTTSGAFGLQSINEDPSQQSIIDQNTTTLYQQKPVPQPRANISLVLLTPKDYGGEYLGMKPLDDWSFNVLAEWRAGEYLTYNPQSVPDIVNNVQLKDDYNIDLRINKTFNFTPVQLTLFVDVRNLLNTKRLSGASFYDGYDQQFYFQSLHLPENPGYDNIPGDDRIGEVRKEGVSFQPIEQVGNATTLSASSIDPFVIYYDRATKRYMNYVNGAWAEVEAGKMQKIIDDKAYIDMPNNSSFDFLNPRQVFFGISLSFTL